MTTQRVIDLARYQFEPPGHYTVHDVLTAYSRERLIAKGKDCMRAWIGFNWLMDIVPPQQEAAKLTSGQVEDFIDYRVGKGVSLLTVKRELTFVKAALHNAHRRNRIALMPYFEIPEGEQKFRRPLSEEEFRLVMRQPMTARLRRFYYVAFHTGHRSRAIEELTWDRVFFEKRQINFNVPGRASTNKRRANDFPITDDFLPRLVSWKERAQDDYVIGLGPTGVCSSTYHESNYVVRELAGLKDATLVPRHCMRKMFATEMFEREVNPEVVGRLMADSPEILRTNYVKFKDSTMLEAANMRTRPKVAREAL